MRENGHTGQGNTIFPRLCLCLIVDLVNSKGINMIVDSMATVITVLNMIQQQVSNQSAFLSQSSNSPTSTNYDCPFCGLTMSLKNLYGHVPLFHIQETGGTVCSICKENVANLPAHLNKHHPPTSDIVVKSSKRPSFSFNEADMNTATTAEPPALPAKSNMPQRKPRQPVFALVVVRRLQDGKFLMVDEVASQVSNCFVLNFFRLTWIKNRAGGYQVEE
jgi:hypothetical protein